MNRIPSLTARQIVKALGKLGFKIIRGKGKGSHQTFYNAKTDQITTVSMHTGDLPRGTVKAILKQSNIPEKDFLKAL